MPRHSHKGPSSSAIDSAASCNTTSCTTRDTNRHGAASVPGTGDAAANFNITDFSRTTASGRCGRCCTDSCIGNSLLSTAWNTSEGWPALCCLHSNDGRCAEMPALSVYLNPAGLIWKTLCRDSGKGQGVSPELAGWENGSGRV